MSSLFIRPGKTRPIIILTIVLLAALTGPGAGKSRVGHCHHNLATLQTQVDAFLRHHPEEALLTAPGGRFIRVLIDRGNLNTELICQGPFVWVYSDLWSWFSFPFGRYTGTKVEVPINGGTLEYRLRRNASGTLTVFCTAHGTEAEMHAMTKVLEKRLDRKAAFLFAFIGLIALGLAGFVLARRAKHGRLPRDITPGSS